MNKKEIRLSVISYVFGIFTGTLALWLGLEIGKLL